MLRTPASLYLGLTLVCSSAALFAAPGTQGVQLQAACAADAAPDPSDSGIALQAMAADPGDLPFYQVVSKASGASVRIYDR